MVSDRKLVTKEEVLDEVGRYMADDMFKAEWVRVAADSIPYAVKKVEEKYRSSNGPNIRYVSIVGSFARKSIGHWKDYEELKRNMPLLSFDDFRKKKIETINKIITRHRDLDLYTITGPRVNTAEISNKLKEELPEPIYCLDDTNFYGFDTSTTVTETQVNRKLKELQRGLTLLLHKHDLEVLNPYPIDDVIPVLAFRDDQYSDPTIREMFDDAIDKGRFRDIETWNKETCLPSIRKFAENLHEYHKIIVDCISTGLDKGDFKIDNKELVEELKQKITNI
jgi:hypothetical protein